MWAAAVFEPALPGRRGAGAASPGPLGVWATHPMRGGAPLVRVRDDQDPVEVHDYLSAGVRSLLDSQLPFLWTSDSAVRIAVSAFSPEPARVSINRETSDRKLPGRTRPARP